MSESNAPFITLGKHLKYVREESRESLMEVSGAVEIDVETLERIEAGQERPEEDVLMLLLNHFGVRDQEAMQLWELAGYEGDTPDQLKPVVELPPYGKPLIMVLSPDTRAHYSDGIDIVVTRSGVTMNFTQEASADRKITVARVGMSHEQVLGVYQKLQIALLKSQQAGNRKQLPPPNS